MTEQNAPPLPIFACAVVAWTGDWFAIRDFQEFHRCSMPRVGTTGDISAADHGG